MKRLFLFLIAFTLLLSGASAGWWDTNYTSKTPINNLVVEFNLDVNDQVLLQGIDFSAMNFACNDLNDLRVVNETLLVELKRHTQGTFNSTDGNVFFQLQNALNAATYNNKFFIYSNNPRCFDTNSVEYLFEDFNNTSNLTLTTTGGTITTEYNHDLNGPVLKIVSNGANNDDLAQVVTKKTYNDENVGVWFKSSSLGSARDVKMHFGGIQVVNRLQTLELTGSGEDFTIAVDLQVDTWYFLIAEKNLVGDANGTFYVFDLNGDLKGSLGDRAGASNWGDNRVILLGLEDNGAADLFFADVLIGITSFSERFVPSFALGTPQSLGLDVNGWRIDGTAFAEPPHIFAFLEDGNILIDFNVFEQDNARLTVDINFSTTNTQGSGTVIVQDLNLDSGHCSDLDWFDGPSVCSWDWNFSGVADDNYFINFLLKNGKLFQDANVFKASSNSVEVSSDVNLLIKIPINEENNVILDMNSYEFIVRILENGVLKIFPGQRDDNGFLILIGTPSPVLVTIDTNAPSVWQSRSYVFSFDSSQSTATLQPFLPPVATSILTTVTTLTTTNLNPIPGQRIRVFKFLQTGRTLVHDNFTDGKGETVVPFVIADEYEIEVFDADGVLLTTKAYIATATSNTLFFYINEQGLVEFPTITQVQVNFRPSIKTHNTTDVNVIVDINSSTSSIVAIQVIMINNDVNIFDSGLDTAAPADGNQYVFIIDEFVSIDNSFPVNFIVIVQLADGTELRFNEDSYWFGRPSSNEMVNLLIFGLRSDFGCSIDTSTNCEPLMIIAFFIILIVAGGLAVEGFRNSMGLIIFVLTFTSVFVYLSWIPLWIYIVMLITGVAALVIRARLE